MGQHGPDTAVEIFQLYGHSAFFCPHIDPHGKIPSTFNQFYVDESRVLVICNTCRDLVVGHAFTALKTDIKREVVHDLRLEIIGGIRKRELEVSE